LLGKILPLEDTVLPEVDSESSICFLHTVDRAHVSREVLKILRIAAKRLRLRSGTLIEWEAKPVWLHSDDFNHEEEMVEGIRHLLCRGEKRDAA
jgi:hypothetical protein